MLTFFNYPKDFKYPQDLLQKSITKSLRKLFKEESISIVFVGLEKIQELNNQYRNVNSPTDVLSFPYETKELLGEVYVCQRYINENTKNEDISIETIRLIIHGILHLYGYDHKSEFIDVNQPNLESMFVIQERILDDVIKSI